MSASSIVLGARLSQVVWPVLQLTRWHAVEVVSTATVEQCSLLVGEIVGGNSVSAVHMNNAIVLLS